jgi:4a-hydroxytetrahydrobiopterin dehydratase
MPKDLQEVAAHTTSRQVIEPSDYASELEALGARWTIENTELTLTLKGPMAKTGRAAAQAGAIADELDHHPKIVVEYSGLTLTIHTHDKNAITVLDLVFAARLEQWLRDNGFGV